MRKYQMIGPKNMQHKRHYTLRLDDLLLPGTIYS